jgi:Na+/proline symporter
MSAVVLEDFFKPYAKEAISEAKSSLIMRGTVLFLGVLSVGLVYVVQHMGSVLQLSMSIPTACFGPMLGVFTIGFLIPWIGTKPTLIAAIFSCASMMFLVFKAQAEIALGNIKFPMKPLFTDGCSYNFTLPETTSKIPVLENDGKHFYEISYLYYALVGSSMVVVIAFLMSFIFGFQDPTEVDARLLAPFLRKYINSKSKTFTYKDAQGKDVIVHKFDSHENSEMIK